MSWKAFATRGAAPTCWAVDMIAMFFGMPKALFPAIAAGPGGPTALGLLFAAPAFGSMAAFATSGWTNHTGGRASAHAGRPFRHLPVMEQGKLIGMLPMRDISRLSVSRE